jgi:hypothetical protein
MNKLAWIAGMLALGAQNGSMPGVRGASPTSAPVIVAAGHVAFVEQEGLNFTPNGKVFFGLTDGAHWLCGTFTTADDLGFVSNTQYNWHSDTFSGCIGWPKARRSPGKDSRSANRLGAGPA